MDVRDLVQNALAGTPLHVIACFSLHGDDDHEPCKTRHASATMLMPRARAVIAVGAHHGHPDDGALADMLLRVDVALARARIGSRRVQPRAAHLPRIFDPLGVWLIDVDAEATEELLKTA